MQGTSTCHCGYVLLANRLAYFVHVLPDEDVCVKQHVVEILGSMAQIPVPSVLVLEDAAWPIAYDITTTFWEIW